MSPTKALPPNYRHYRTLTLSTRRMTLFTNVLGLVLLFVFGWLFMGVAAWLHPQLFVLELTIFAQTLGLFEFIGSMVGVIVLHELIHALGFWWFTRERPSIGITLLYAYAAAPDWCFPRRQMAIIGLAPLVVITLLGLLYLPNGTLIGIPRVLVAITVNAAGSVGDMITVAWLLSHPPDVLARDEGAHFTLYRASGE